MGGAVKSGEVPSAEDCVLVPLPPVRFLRGEPREDINKIENMRPPAIVYVRALRREYADSLPVKTVVPGVGLVRVGERGWSV